jgi:MtN3 and saliva related transmembrane protein
MEAQDLLGYFAALMTTVAFVPQAWKTFKTHDVSGISLRMYTVFTTGVAAWLAYGILQKDWPIILANAVTLGLALCVLVMRLRFKAKGP